MFLYDALGFFEKHIAKAQGKGFGSNSIEAEIKSIKKLLGQSRPADSIQLCIDMGGNVGDYSAALLRHFPAASIVCFEPSKTNIEKLSSRFGDSERISVQPVGLSRESATVPLYSDLPGSGLASMTKRDLSHFGREFEAEESIQVIRFDDFWRTQLGESNIDILKLDIEGHELDALNGCGSAIQATSLVQFEFGGTNVDTRTYFRDFWQFFNDAGFDIHRITPFGVQMLKKYRERDECFRTTNFLALKRR